MNILGIDVGASGIKGAIVDTLTGQLLTDRYRVEMPSPSTPNVVADAFAEIAKYFNWTGVIGCGFPSVIKNGVALTAANIDKSWIGTNVEKLLSDATGCPVYAANDADLAGIAEMHFGVGKDVKGVVILITIGTGLGSAIFIDGKLLPNTEFGHIYLKHGQVAEHFAANSAQKRENLTYKEWGKRFNEYLGEMEKLFWPDLIILGGGTSKNFKEFEEFLDTKCKLKPAKLYNNAGIVGAATLGVIKHL